MKNTLKTLSFWSVAVLVACTYHACGALPELTAAQEKFSSYMAALTNKHANDMSVWEREYRNALEVFVQRSQQSGKLEDLLRGRGEVARFEKIPVLTPRMAQAMKGDLRTVAEEYSARAEGTMRAHNESLVSLFESYASSLERLESHLTTEGSIDAAVEVRRARSSCLEDDVLRCARFELAAAQLNESDAGATAERPVVLDLGPVPDTAAPPDRIDEMAPQPEMTTVHGVSVYHSGSPEREKGISFKRLVLNRTPNAPIRSQWSVSGQMARRDTSKPGGAYMSKVFGWRLRISIKALLAQDEPQDIMLVTQYFNRPAVGRGKVEPRLAKTLRTPLLLSAGASALLDYPSFDVWTARIKSGGAYGEEFYGVVVSVFNAEGELEYQATSMRGLEELAATDLPGASPEENRFTMMALVDAARRDLAELELRQRTESRKDRSVWDYMRMAEANWRLNQLRTSLERLQEQE